MKTRRILMGIIALVMVAATVIACSKKRKLHNNPPKWKPHGNPSRLSMMLLDR